MKRVLYAIAVLLGLRALWRYVSHDGDYVGPWYLTHLRAAENKRARLAEVPESYGVRRQEAPPAAVVQVTTAYSREVPRV